MASKEVTVHKLSRHLLALAEKDKWSVTLYILLHYPKKINFNARTEAGDYLIHLAAFASCEQHRHKSKCKLEIQKYALVCLSVILDRDFTAINKVAGDGGNALHCALAAAASFEHFHVDDESDQDDSDAESYSTDADADSDENDNYDTDDDENDDKTYQIDKDLMNQLKLQAEQDIYLVKHCSEYSSLSTQGVILTAIKLLIKHDTDLNTPLANLNNLTLDQHQHQHQSEEQDQEQEDQSEELAYSREAVVQQWTPLMFALEWLIRVATAYTHDHNTNVAERVRLTQFLPLPILVLALLIRSGADPTYMTAAAPNDGDGDWNALHFMASSAHVICTIHLTQELFLQIHNIDPCVSFHTSLPHHDIKRNTLFQFLSNILMDNTNITNKATNLSSLQSFAIAILSNDAHHAQSIIETELHSRGITCKKPQHKSHILNDWRSVNMYNVLPLLQAVWGTRKLAKKNTTLLEMASSCLALDSIRLLMGDDGITSMVPHQEISCAITSLFQFTDSPHHARTTDDQTQYMRRKLALSLLLNHTAADGTHHTIHKTDAARQMLLDRALMESCACAQSAPSTISLLLQCGADPLIPSIADTVQDGLKPIHLVAGNCRGKNGVFKVKSLLGCKPCADAPFTQTTLTSRTRQDMLFGMMDNSNENVLHLSLKQRNFRVAICLWEMQLQCDCDKGIKSMDDSAWEIEYATLLGEAAIDGFSIKLFRAAVDAITMSSSMGKPTETSKIEKVLAKLLLWAVDERSGFGIHFSDLERRAPSEKGYTNLQADAVDIILHQQKQMNLSNLSSWARDEITGHTPLHLLLRADRGVSLRKSLIQPLCKIMTNNALTQTTPSTNLISIPCAEKFGLYTPLHLACVLNCDESIRTLIAFGADQTAVDGYGNKPSDLLPDSVRGAADKMKHFTKV